MAHPPRSKKTDTIEVRVSPELKSALGRFSETRGQSMSETVRDLVGRELAPPADPIGQTGVSTMARLARSPIARFGLLSASVLGLAAAYTLTPQNAAVASVATEARVTIAAHDRNGDDNLAREFYSLAVEASDSAPAETLRYVQILMEDRRSFFTAEELLISALRLEPGQPDLMRTLGMLYLRMQDWARAEQVETTLRDAGDEISLAYRIDFTQDARPTEREVMPWFATRAMLGDGGDEEANAKSLVRTAVGEEAAGRPVARFIIDTAPGTALPNGTIVRSDVGVTNGRVAGEPIIQYNQFNHAYRVFFDVIADGTQPVELRATLRGATELDRKKEAAPEGTYDGVVDPDTGPPLSETWLYRWDPPRNADQQ